MSAKPCLVFGWVGQQTSLSDLQIVVPRKVKGKVPGHGFYLAKFCIDYHAFDAIHDRRPAPRRVGQMTAKPRSTWAKLAHHAAQSVSPVAGPKGFAVNRDALNKDFFRGIGDHRMEGFSSAWGTDRPYAAVHHKSIL